jgi:hypothetical protein
VVDPSKMDDSRLNHLVGAALISISVGGVSFFGSCYLFACIGIWTHLIPLALFGPQPKGYAQAMFVLYASAVLTAVTLAWLTFRRLDRNYWKTHYRG